MANDSINTVPLGTAGTGAAYLLPDSNAISNINDYINQQTQQKAQQAQQKQQQAQQMAAAWKANQLKIKGGTLYQPEINTRAAKVMQMGMDLQKAGINPNTVYSDPAVQSQIDDYQQQRQALLSDVDVRDKISAQAAANEKLLSESPDGTFDPQSVQNYHDFISGKIPLSTISGQGLQMPELKKAFNLSTVLDKMPGVPIQTTRIDPKTGIESKMVLPNEQAHQELANTLVSTNPEVQADIAAKAGMPFNQIGDQTDPTAIRQQLDDYYRSIPAIPSLAAQGIRTFGNYGQDNSNGINDTQVGTVPAAPKFKEDPAYANLLNTKSLQMANAARVKSNYLNTIKTTLDNKVHQQDDKTLNFKYQEEMRARRRMGMEEERFNDWKEKQQYEAGTFTLGNQDSYVPVAKTWVNPDGSAATGDSIPTDADGNAKAAGTVPEPGASLYGVNLPDVKVVVRPGTVTNLKTGRSLNNTEPLDVNVSQIQMVPVFKGVQKDLNGSEISARQLKEIVSGTNKNLSLANITFQPFAYGLQQVKTKDANGNLSHNGTVPIKFSYDALKGSNVKKINTTTFDQATEELKALQANPKFQSMSPQDQLSFIQQRYNLKL